MDAILERAGEKAAVQAQVDLLREIDLWRARRQYDKAVAGLQSFPALYPNSPLMPDLNKLRERVAKYQERDLRAEVVRSWHHWTRRLAQTAARKLSYEEVLAYLDGPMTEEVLTKVHEELKDIASEIQPDEVRRLWEERKGGKMRQASYGNGTWLLGEGRARAGVEKESDEPAEAGSQNAERQKIEGQDQSLPQEPGGGQARQGRRGL